MLFPQSGLGKTSIASLTGRSPVASEGLFTIFSLTTIVVEPPPSSFIASTAPSSSRRSYEQDFLSCSYGYRPRVGALEAVDQLTVKLQFGGYHHVVEADIKGFFDNLSHEWLMRMPFSRYRRGETSFDFLGSEFRWGTDRKG